MGRRRRAQQLKTMLARIVGLALFVLSTAACTHVAPYDRGRLAHPTMIQGIESAAAGHLHAVQEGAAGGGSVAESGCGCN